MSSITRSETLYKININDAVTAAGGTYSGSIGPVGEDNLIKIQYTVLFENLNQTEETTKENGIQRVRTKRKGMKRKRVRPQTRQNQAIDWPVVLPIT